MLVNWVRRLLRAACGERPWLVHDVERGIIRREPTRRAAQRWARKWELHHDYNREMAYMILPVDRCAAQGIDPGQQELYPGRAYDNGPL